VVLHIFAVMSGLQVNFNKSMLVGVNVDDSCQNKVALVLNCKVGRLPFMYLGLPIGGDARWLKFWESLLYRLKF